MMKLFQTIVLVVFCLFNCKLNAQMLEYLSIYPELPFDIIKAFELKNSKCTIWKSINKKGKNDVSGELWSQEIEFSHQFEKYIFYDGVMNEFKQYNTNGDKVISMEYFYREGLLSAIETLVYDSLFNSSLDYAYAYFYRADSTPLQRVKMFPHPHKKLRILDVFEFDNSNRLVKLKSEAVGYSPKIENVTDLKPGDKRIEVFRFNDSIREEIIYENLYKILTEKKIYYDDSGKIIYKELRDGSGELLKLTQYNYKDDENVKEIYHVDFDSDSLSDNKKLLKDSIDLNNNEIIKLFCTKDQFALKKFADILEYFEYDENSLKTIHIKENDFLQEVYEFSYFLE